METVVIQPHTPAEIITTGTEDEIIRLLNRGFNINNYVKYDNATGNVLHWAARRGFTKVLDWIKAKLPEINPNPAILNGAEEGWTPLHLAASYGKMHVLAWYRTNYPAMDMNPAIAHGPIEGYTPVHMAALAGQTSVLDWYKTNFPTMDMNPPIAYGPDQGQTPRNIALINKNQISYRYLIFLDASQLEPIRRIDQIAPLTQLLLNCGSRIKDSIDEIERLQRKLDSQKVENLSQHEIDACMSCMRMCHTAIKVLIEQLKQLVELGAEIDAPEQTLHATTPLHLLMHAPMTDLSLYECIHWLITERHANVNALDLKGNTPLTLACAKGNLLLVRLLLSHGADPSIGNNPFIAAHEHGNFDKMRPLFEKILKIKQPE